MENAQAPVTLGTSLLVPSVQEMAKKPLSTVPERYVRNDEQEPHLVMKSDSTLSIPIIDMQALLEGDLMNFELEKLHSACKDWGFFQLVNHRVSPALLDKTRVSIQDFFNVPKEEKKKFWQTETEVEGFGQAFVVSEEQKLDWADMFTLTTLPVYLRKPHLFPLLPFRETLEEYSSAMKTLAMSILGMMTKALQMDVEEMKLLFEDGMQSMRMNYYPPCPQPEQVIGLSPHSDPVALNILLEVNEMEGLQVRKDGMWIPIKTLPNAFIVNVGDILEIVTNGIYRSIEHRAVVNSSKERLSIVTACNPKLEREVGPSPSLIKHDTTGTLFKRVSVEEYLRGLLARKLDGKAYLESFRTGSGKSTT